MNVDLSSLVEPAVLVAIVGAIGAFMGIRYRTRGKSLTEQMKDLREQNQGLQQEIDNLKIQLAPNQTPCIWVNSKNEIVSFNGSAILKVFTRLGLSSTKSYGRNLSSVIGDDNVQIIKSALTSHNQTATLDSFIVAGKLTVKFAVAYVIYDTEMKDAVIELQLIV